MTVTLTYDATLSRVQVNATGLGGALTAVVERSTNQITWAAVRGGVDVPITAGVSATVNDYEFAPDVTNYYRLRYLDTVTFVSAGTSAHAANASVAPGLPAGRAAGDALLILAATRASAQGTPTTPAGYTELVNAGNVRVHAKTAGSSESTPTVAFTGAGDATMSVSAQMCAFRGARAVLGATAASALNGSAQNIATPAYTPVSNNSVLVWIGWKQDTTRPAGVPSDIGSSSTTLGDDQGIVWAYQVQTTAAAAGASSFTVTGGASASSRGIVLELLANEISQSNSITPALGSVWIKNLARPFLNRAVTVNDWSDVERPSRNGVFPIVGRTYPVAVTDLRLSRSYDLIVTTSTVDDANELDLCLASGEPVLVHVPADCPMPGMYAVVGDVKVSRREARSTRRYLTLPLVECAAPGADIVGATNTWSAVIAGYITWTATISANATWQDVLDGVADPGDVIVS
jgi:hypothetical protein